jgi:hypothetical protein
MCSSEVKRCAYCGRVLLDEGTGDHVFPKNLVPKTLRPSWEPIIVPSCLTCNQKWSDAEEHFRNVVDSAGDFNQAAEGLFRDKIQRSLRRSAGERRIRDLLSISELVDVDGQPRLKIYPAKDPRVLGIIRKIVVGLSYHHGVETALKEARIFADVLRFRIPSEYLERLHHHVLEADVIEYWYGLQTEPQVHSVWILRFYGRTTFVALVSESPDGDFGWDHDAAEETD